MNKLYKKKICLICARKGSKGIKKKNIKLFAGKPLIFWTIKFAKELKIFDEIYLSTDCKDIAKFAKKEGVKVPFLRDKHLSTDNVSEILVWNDFNKKLNLNDQNIDFICVLPVTSPLRKKIDIIRALEKFKKNRNKLNICISESKKNPEFNIVKINKFNNIKRLVETKKLIHTRQNASKYYTITTFCYIYKPSIIFNKNSIFDMKLSYNLVPTSRSIDIDDIEDFKYAEYKFKLEY